MIEENKDFQKSDDKDETKGLETNWFESVDSFHKLGLKEDVLKGIYGSTLISILPTLYFFVTIYYSFFILIRCWFR